MKKLKKIFLIIFLIFILFLLVDKKVFASTNLFQKVEYSEEYKKWLELTDEEKKNVIQPRMYDVLPQTDTSKSIFYKIRLLGATINPTYNLKDVIPTNLQIRNQMHTNTCWAFATLSSLETNLALYDYKKNNTDAEAKVYDFSERHMDYSTSNSFTESESNKKFGYNRKVEDGGNWIFAQSYLTNGSGPINEDAMTFQDNTNLIALSEIQNKTVTSQVYDTVEFADYNKNPEQKSQIMGQIKQHIKNYGSVYAAIHGNFAEVEYPCYDNTNGSIYCNDAETHKLDHAVSIIGWDDNYDKNNFPGDKKPNSNGAWIIRNSWGEKIEYELSELKKEIFKILQQEGKTEHLQKAEEITTEMLTKAGYTVDEGQNKAYLKLGNDGFMYISYEDCNVATTLCGIIKATDGKNYEKIYQYDEHYPMAYVETTNGSKVMLCNIFEKQTDDKEYLTQISIYAPETYNCKVYVNPKGEDHNKENLQPVSLKAGQSETFGTGYHTLEFAEPIEISKGKFAVVVEIQGTRDKVMVSLEAKPEGISQFDYVQVETDKCFIQIENGSTSSEWLDLGKSTDGLNGDSTIKAFTTSTKDEKKLESIEIVTPPDKVNYLIGENFEKEGMKVQANYSDKSNVILYDTDYSITNGTNLSEGQQSVTISYADKTTTQNITVEKNTVTSLVIETPPTKTEYIEGENFNSEGMVVKAIYKDGTSKEVSLSEYTIEDGNNLKAEQTHVTISYEGQTVTQDITVTPNPLVEINITKAPNKTSYVVGQNFDPEGMVVTGTYQNESTQEILDYTIENGTNLTKEQTSVTIKYEEKTAMQPITVEEKQITKITINAKPTKLTYIKNKENLNLEGGTLKVTYNDGTTEIIEMTSEEVTVSGFSNENVGTVKVTVTYQNKTTEFEVQIIEEEKAENSKMDEVAGNVKKVKAYYYTNNSKKDYILIDVEVDNISINTNNDSLEYYYYLSPNANEQDITDWVKITEKQNSNNKLQFTIDTRKISNYNEISDEGVLYLYVKEVAIKGGDQSIAISKPMKLETDKEVETYIDDVKKDTSKPSPSGSGKDDTTAPGYIPNTGIAPVIIICITVLAILSVVIYIKYNKFKDAK